MTRTRRLSRKVSAANTVYYSKRCRVILLGMLNLFSASRIIGVASRRLGFVPAAPYYGGTRNHVDELYPKLVQNSVFTVNGVCFSSPPQSTIGDDEPNKAWVYRPDQKPVARSKRFFSSSSSWRVPNRVTIPMDQVETSFSRSSGSGGQNVNKVNTKVDMRFKVMGASWLPMEVRERLLSKFPNRISKEGYLTVSSQQHRTQAQNREDAQNKLEQLILQAYERPKERRLRKGVSKKTKEKYKEQKRRRSQVKANRKKVDF